MIYAFFNGMITLMLAKFIMNDLPHAAGFLTPVPTDLRLKISKYYEETEVDYRLIWRSGKTLAIHYGYHAYPSMPHDEAAIEMIRQLAVAAGITSSDFVLDAGCGVGGSTIWLAKNIGCRVIGINITESQLEVARAEAAPGTEFYNMDFCATSFPDQHFTVVWALESSCYAPDKLVFIREAYRLLKPGGKLAVADGFGAVPDSMVLQGWEIPNLAGVDQFRGYMEEAGFTNIKFRDISQYVMPSSKRMYRAAMSVYPLHKLSKVLHTRTEVQYRNIEAAIEQYNLLKSGEFRYCIFVGEK